MEPFVNRIFDLLKKSGKSAKELAISIGVSQGNVTDWKNGRSKPSAIQIPKIAEFFGVTTDAIYYGTDSSTPIGNGANNTLAAASGFDKLSPQDQEEINMIIKMRLERQKNQDE
ncbi:helix-turn-helix domain-containing protein [Christensenella hongkongensis]|uniref:HTH cro/C1-type domain-containing protein n=1 Tax=Christensenella hongkongensis TaxID=270498 RepID=A0A0M2NHK1_9FIRM|nr:helix-turn-helix transcriptional regulator [Christensenella hongkongensis]KKI52004.1 hypothetical protein CHK_0521 [Christensenella hongkongensis]TCW24799.1 DNA-binding XRE family transcriptional regulator [Christensenella hongkongensis]